MQFLSTLAVFGLMATAFSLAVDQSRTPNSILEERSCVFVAPCYGYKVLEEVACALECQLAPCHTVNCPGTINTGPDLICGSDYRICTNQGV